MEQPLTEKERSYFEDSRGFYLPKPDAPRGFVTMWINLTVDRWKYIPRLIPDYYQDILDNLDRYPDIEY
jgi:hypothetical protein